MKMSGPVPMSPSTAPDSAVSQGSAASAPAGMVSGNDGAVHAGTTPVYHMGDPLQGSGDPWASTTPWLSFSHRRFLCCFTKYSNWIAKSIQSWREWAEWQHCHIWDATRVFGPWTNPGTHSSSRPGDGTAAAPTDVAHPRGDGSFQ